MKIIKRERESKSKAFGLWFSSLFTWLCESQVRKRLKHKRNLGFTPTPNFGVSLYSKRGFTLIELLIVIAIIGLLSSVVLASLNSARKKARDARRISDIKQIRTALEFYYDKYGYYPGSGECGATTPNGAWSNSVQCLSAGRWLRDSATNMAEFLPSDPIDPLNQNNWLSGAYYYFSRGYGGDKQWYMIIYGLENYPNSLIENSDGVRAPDGSFFHYGDGSNGIITVGVNSQN